MNRREFVLPFQNLASQAPFKVPMHIDRVERKLSTGISPYSGSWTNVQVGHLLRRTMFGATLEDINYFMGKGMAAAVDELLRPISVPPSPPVNAYNTAQSTDPNVPAGQTWVNAADDPLFNNQRRFSLKAWWLGLMIRQSRSIHEKMVLFWHNHFATETNVYLSAKLAYQHNVMLRNGALGNFKTMVKTVTKDAAMLRYLNGYLNTKAAPDENYARELQELFTVGKDLNPHFTESDVKQAAKILTGWQLDLQGKVSFNLIRHDTSDKQFSAFYNNTKITGKNTPTAGDDELDDLLNMIFSHDEVARFMCRKLYRFFVYYEIDAATEQNVIVPLAQIFRNSGYDITAVLSALFQSEHFYDMANVGCVIKSPAEFIAGMCRQTYLQFPDPAVDYDSYYKHLFDLYTFCFVIGQDLGDPPNVAGWPAYYQIPAFHELWINSDSLPKRNQITDLYATVGNKKNNITVAMDWIALAKKFSNPADPNKLIDDACAYLHASLTLSSTSKAAIKVSALLSGQTQDSYWTSAWNQYISNPGNATYKQTVSLRLLLLFRYLLALSEYQLS